MLRRLRKLATRTARGEEGMTLVEVLVGSSAAMVVIFAAYGAVAAATNMQTRTTNRVESAQRGRSAMETITRDIRAQMCVATQSGVNSAPTPAMLWASGDGVQFYSSVQSAPSTASAAPLPEMRRLEWTQTGGSLNSSDPSAQPVGKIVESVWRPTNSSPPYNFPPQSSPTKVTTIATDVEHARASNGAILPIFNYYGYTVTNGVGRPSSTPYPFVASPSNSINPSGKTSVASGNLAKIVLIDIQFAARPLQQKVTDAGVTGRPTSVVPLFNRVSVRTADPTDPGVSPLCM